MRITEAVSLALSLAALAGCVASRAGFDRVRTDVGPSLARELPMGDVDGDRQVRALLARPLDADAAVRVALLTNPEVRALLAEVGVARGELFRASVLPNPRAEAEVYFGDDGVGFEGTLLLDLGGMLRTPLGRAVAEAELAAEAADAALAILRIAYEARIAFVRYQASEQTRALLQTVVEASRASYDAAQMLRDAGNATALAVSQEEALYQEARLALANAELALLEAREQLTVRMGLHGEQTEWEAEPTLPAPPETELELARLEARAVDASVALGAVRERMHAVSQQMVVATSAAVLPSIRAGVAVRREEQVWSVGPAMEVALPVFGGGVGALQTEAARFAVLEQRYAARAIALRSLVRRARNRMVVARERERFLRETLLPLRQRIVEETMEQHNAMNASIFQLLLARRAQLESALEHVAALHAYWTARAALEQLLAGGWVELDEVRVTSMPVEVDARARGRDDG